MLMAITALDVACRARRIVVVGRTFDSPTQRVEWAYRWTHRCMLWRSQRRTMWRVVLTGSWPRGARSTAQLYVSSGRIDGIIDACYGDHNGARCGASCLRYRGRGAHDRQPYSTCRVGASMGSSVHAYGDHNGARCDAYRCRGCTIDSQTQRVEWVHRWGHRCMPMATTTALDVTRRARRNGSVGARSTANLTC